MFNGGCFLEIKYYHNQGDIQLSWLSGSSRVFATHQHLTKFFGKKLGKILYIQYFYAHIIVNKICKTLLCGTTFNVDFDELFSTLYTVIKCQIIFEVDGNK